jgi:hypothetical protein
VKWLGSYRYAIVNLGGADRDDLARRFADICRQLTFEEPAFAAVPDAPQGDR